MKINDYLISLIRYKVCGAEAAGGPLLMLDGETLDILYSMSKKQDISHIIGASLSEKKLLPSDASASALFSQDHMLAVFRYRRLTDELARLRAFFEEAGIYHIALKGSVLREYYPEPWMRTSCDIDILIKKSDLEKASALLIEKLEYRDTDHTPCDVSFESKTGVHLELHFALMPDDRAEGGDKLLSLVWQTAYPAEDKTYTLFMTDEVFYSYHIVHMAKHFESGGCGIKAFLDLWVLENRVPHDKEKRQKLIIESKYADFERGAKRLVDVWFSGAEGDAFTTSLEEFVFAGGAYGTVENGVKVGVVKKGGRVRYLLSRIFPPYSVMRILYPVLDRHKILIFGCYVARWFRIVFVTGTKHAKSQISHSGKISESKNDEITRLLSDLGLLE